MSHSLFVTQSLGVEIIAKIKDEWKTFTPSEDSTKIKPTDPLGGLGIRMLTHSV